MGRIVRVSAPSRLHFGLLRFDQEVGASFGGLGMMVDEPRTVVELEEALQWKADGPLAKRAMEFAQMASRSFDPSTTRAVHIRTCDTPAQHCGLGTGTQLGLSVARGLRELWQLEPLDPTELALSVRRGRRSAVGSYGFFHGGLIWETGRRASASLGTLANRTAVPSVWRIVLLTPPEELGMHGHREIEAFSSLGPMPLETTNELQRLAKQVVLPAAEQANFESFSEGVYEYGRLAGSCFTSVQGGPFASPRISALVDQLRDMGIRGVGQSSWGPTVFALVADNSSAQDLMAQLQKDVSLADTRISIVCPENRGARVEIVA